MSTRDEPAINFAPLQVRLERHRGTYSERKVKKIGDSVDDLMSQLDSSICYSETERIQKINQSFSDLLFDMAAKGGEKHLKAMLKLLEYDP